jgi:redox-sensitive bicupin YhaK (pirin superfamily)
MIGPWCFLDRFGPVSFASGRPMDVGAHPHIGLQTVSWLLEGEMVHYDSLGNEAALGAGGVNVMTAGSGIAHAEQTPVRNSGRLSGVQLWIALEDAHRNRAAAFEHVARVPSLVLPGGAARVFCGVLDSTTSPARTFSPLVGADLQIHEGETMTLPLDPRFEHGFFLLGGDASFEGQVLEDRTLYYLAASRSEGAFSSREGARVLLVGGAPFTETILMWWNFVARTREEISLARADWQDRRRFLEIPGYAGARIDAPPRP